MFSRYRSASAIRLLGSVGRQRRWIGDAGAAPTSLDRLLRFKPALTQEEGGEEDEREGLPDERADLQELGDDERNPLFRVGKSLLRLGKVHYRHIEMLPEWMAAKQAIVCSHRTPAQIRRCLANWMIQPDRELLQRYRNRRLTWRLNVKEEDEHKEAAKTVAYGPEETVAYSTYFMPSRFQITRRVFREVQQLLPSFRPARMLDFGCGPATAGCAAVEVWGQQSSFRYTGIDMSRAMIDAAKTMIADKVPDAVFWDRSSDVVQRASQPGAAAGEGRFDLVVSSFTLTELTNDPTRRAAVQLLFELLDVGGVLVIVEPGNPFGSHTTRTARQFILDNFGSSPSRQQDRGNPEGKKKARGSNAAAAESAVKLVLPTQGPVKASVVSPCTHDRACPLAQGVWCSFSQRVHSAMIRKGFEEKFSYVVIQKTAPQAQAQAQAQVHEWVQDHRPAAPAPHSSVPSPLEILSAAVDQEPADMPAFLEGLVDKYDIDWETYSPLLRREEWARVVRSPIKSKGHVTVDLCVPSGVLTRSVLSKGNMLQVPALYSAMRKTTWGGLFPVLLDEEERSPLMQKSAGAVNRVVRGGDQLHIDDEASSSSGGGEETEREKETRKRRVLLQQFEHAMPPRPERRTARTEMQRAAVVEAPARKTGRRSSRLRGTLSLVRSRRAKEGDKEE